MHKLLARAWPACQGLLIAGPLCGQGQLLGKELWRQTVRLALDQVPPAIPLLVGLTAGNSTETLARARWLGGQGGGRALWGLDLALYHHSNRGLPAHVSALAQALGGPVLLMNHPGLVQSRRKKAKRANFITSVLAKCAAGDALAGLVYAGGLRLGLSLQRALRQDPGRPEPAFYDGDEAAFLARPAAGGVVSQGAGLLPADWALVAGQSLASGRTPDPRRRQELLAAAGRVGRLAALLAPGPAPVAAFLAHRAGLIASPRSLTPPPRVAALAAAESWAQQEWPN
jgi:dihydrodipicolinate synthase/N-acetylneuraminate lyase